MFAGDKLFYFLARCLSSRKFKGGWSGGTLSDIAVAFLIGRDTVATRHAIEAVAVVPGVRVAGVLIDTARPSFARRRKNLWRNIRRDGWGYPFARLLTAAHSVADGMAATVVGEADVAGLLHRAFPERSLSLQDLTDRFGFALCEVGNLNGEQARSTLQQLSVDLGIVLGTRILKRSIFAVPRMGCINLHKGKVPEYRGMPPGFWELYDRSATAGVTVHYVDDTLDTGDIVGTREIPIHSNETESSLRYKLDVEGAALLAECVGSIRAGTATVTPQPPHSAKPRSIPSRRQREELRRRIAQAPQEPGVKHLVKTLLYLGCYYSGLYGAVRGMRRLTRRSRAVVLLYHRVNDFSNDALTVSTRRFAEHLCLFRKYYQVRSTEWLVNSLRSGSRIPPETVLIHFDDCYADVLHEGGQLLRACQMPATTFIASGYVDTDKVFEHDAKKYPFQYPNFTEDDVRRLPDFGFEVGAHTVNHANLGEISLEAARFEVTESRSQLQKMLGREVRFFSFPWGRLDTIREEVRSIVKSAEYDAMFSAHGGFVDSGTDLYDIPRCGASSQNRPLDLMMELEGLSPSGIVHVLRGLLRPKSKSATATMGAGPPPRQPQSKAVGRTT